MTWELTAVLVALLWRAKRYRRRAKARTAHRRYCAMLRGAQE